MQRLIPMPVLVIAFIAFLLSGVDGALHLHSRLRDRSSSSTRHANAKPHAAVLPAHDGAKNQQLHAPNAYTSCTVISYDDPNCLTYPQGELTQIPLQCDATTNTVLEAEGTQWSITTYHSPNCTDFAAVFNGTMGQCSQGTNVLCSGSGPTPPPPPSATNNTLSLFNVNCETQFWQSSFISGQCLPGPGGDAPFLNWRVTVDSSTSVFTAEFFNNSDCSDPPLVTDASRGDMCMTNKLFINYQIQAPINSLCSVTTYINTECSSSSPLNTYAATPTVCVPGTVYTVATNKLLIDPKTQNWTIQYFNTSDTSCTGPIVGTETGSADQCDQGGNRKVQCSSLMEPIQLA